MQRLFRIATIIAPGILFLKLLRACLRRPKWVLALSAVLFSLSLLKLNQLQVMISIPEMLSKESEERQSVDMIQESFAVGEPVAVLFSQRTGQPLTNRDLCAIKTWLHGYEFQHQQTTSLLSPFKVARASLETQSYLFYRSPLAHVCDLPPFETAASEQWAQDNPKSLLLSSDASTLVAEIQFLKDKTFHGPYGQYKFEDVKSMRASLDTHFSSSQPIAYRLQSAGSFKLHFIESMIKDGSLNLIILGILLILMRVFYGTWKSGLLLAGTLFVTTLFIVGLMAWVGTPLDVLSTSLFVILSLAAAEDFIYLTHLQRSSKDKHWRVPYREMILPSFYTSLTTFVGFFSLTLSDILPIQRLGFWAGIGCMVEWAVTLFLLPALISCFPRFRYWIKGSISPLEKHVTKLLNRRVSTKILVASLAVMVLSVHSIFTIKSTDAIDKMWSPSHPFNESLAFVQNKFAWRSTVDVVFPGDLNQLQIQTMMRTIGTHRNVVNQDDPWTQLDRFTSKVTAPDVQALARREAAQSDYFGRYFSHSGSWTRVVYYLNTTNLDDLLSFKQHVLATCGDHACKVSGEGVALASFSNKVIQTLIHSFIVSLVIVACLLLSLFYACGIKQAVPILISSFWGPVVLLAFTNILLGGVNFVTCVFASVLVGLAGDSAIQFIFSRQAKNSLQSGIADRQGGALVVSLTLSLASLAYLNSSYEQPKTLGVLFCLGYIVLLFGDVVILKALLQLHWFQKKIPAPAAPDKSLGGAYVTSN